MRRVIERNDSIKVNVTYGNHTKQNSEETRAEMMQMAE